MKLKEKPLRQQWNSTIIILTGTISPCQVKMFDSSTWMLRKFFIPDLRISSSSWEKIAQIQDMISTERSFLTPETKAPIYKSYYILLAQAITSFLGEWLEDKQLHMNWYLILMVGSVSITSLEQKLMRTGHNFTAVWITAVTIMLTLQPNAN